MVPAATIAAIFHFLEDNADVNFPVFFNIESYFSVTLQIYNYFFIFRYSANRVIPNNSAALLMFPPARSNALIIA